MSTIRFNRFAFGRVRAHILPVLVWLAVIAVVVVLLRHRAERFQIVGLARSKLHQSAANCEGRLEQLSVELFNTVRKGQLLAVVCTLLDNENIEAQLNTVKAEIKRLQAEIDSTRSTFEAEAANRETDWFAGRRRFAIDVESARLRVLETKAQLETDRMTLRNLQMEKQTVEKLVEKDAVSAYELKRAEMQCRVVAARIEEYKEILTRSTDDLIEAGNRLDKFFKERPEHPSTDKAIEPIRQAINVQQSMINELISRRQPLLLKSPVDGVVKNILHRPGEVVLAGEPIVTIAEKDPREVIAYANEAQLAQVRTDMTIELVKRSEPAQIASSQVVYVGPTLEMIPQQLWQNSNIPEWGLPVLIKIPPDMKLIPGEVVGIRGI